MMSKRKMMKQIGARLDGETRYAGRHATPKDEASKEYEAAVLQLRHSAACAARAPEISDTQFNAFMQGICEGIETPSPRYSKVWTLASLAAAALVLLLSVLAYFGTGSEPVRATEVESVYTELDGVTVHYYDTPQGVSTVQVTMPENDLW